MHVEAMIEGDVRQGLYPLGAATEELIAIGAALPANCEPCLWDHVRRGAEAGCTPEAMSRAVEIVQGVKETPVRLLIRLADRLLAPSPAEPEPGPRCEDPAIHLEAPGDCCFPPRSR